MTPGERNGSRVVLQLITKHEGYIRRLIVGRSGPAVLKLTTPDDIFQQTVTLAVSLGEANKFTYSNDTGFLRWISTLARRTISSVLGDRAAQLNSVRIKGAESTGVGVSEDNLRDPARSPSSFVAGREQVAKLRAELRELPEHYQRVLTLYLLEGRSLPEVAQAMERTKGAVCRLVARAVSQLRDAMNEP